MTPHAPAPLRVLLLMEQGSYRFDHRARRIARTLQDAGAHVAAICPAFEGEPLRDVVDGVDCYRYPFPGRGEGFASHLVEYAASLSCLAALTARIACDPGFDVIHVINPPDLLCLIAGPCKLLGKRYVFDHYDLGPELFAQRFGEEHRGLTWAVHAAERASVRLADHVLSMNETYRRVAIERCGAPPERVSVVRNGPDLARFRPTTPDPETRAMADVIVGYLGNMNPQDGLDHFMEMARILRHERGRADIAFVLVGHGDSFDDVVRWRSAWKLEDCVRLTGRLAAEAFMPILSAADIFVQSDPPTPFNDTATMMKLMEYMALGKPVVAYDLAETRVSGGDICRYATPADPRALADAVEALADDPDTRLRLGQAGLERVRSRLSWPHQAPHLLAAYDRLFPGRLALTGIPTPPGSDAAPN